AQQALGLGEHPGLVPGVGVLGIAAPDPRRREGALNPGTTKMVLSREAAPDGLRLGKDDPVAVALVEAIQTRDLESLEATGPGSARPRIGENRGRQGRGGADIEASGASIAGGTPLDDAVGYRCWQVARLLVERGAQVNRLWHAAALGMMSRVEE